MTSSPSTITVFGADWCRDCVRTKNQLSSLGVSYDYVDLVVDPVRGDPVKRIRLPEEAAPGTAFSTIVDGKPVVGALLANPLRVVLF